MGLSCRAVRCPERTDGSKTAILLASLTSMRLGLLFLCGKASAVAGRETKGLPLQQTFPAPPLSIALTCGSASTLTAFSFLRLNTLIMGSGDARCAVLPSELALRVRGLTVRLCLLDGTPASTTKTLRPTDVCASDLNLCPARREDASKCHPCGWRLRLPRTGCLPGSGLGIFLDQTRPRCGVWALCSALELLCFPQMVTALAERSRDRPRELLRVWHCLCRGSITYV